MAEDNVLWRLLGNNLVAVNRALANHGLGTSQCLAMTRSQQYRKRLFSMWSVPRLYNPS
jgi:hypothetical protein